MTDQEIKNDISNYVSKNYSIWTIGITDRPTQRKTEHSNPEHWHQWNASSEKAAREVETYFIAKGCKGGSGGKGNGDYVYIF